MSSDRRFYENPVDGGRRTAPAALRNRQLIADVLADWLPASGSVLEIASGTGEHVVHFAERFPALEWQPSDLNDDALASIEAWRTGSRLPNIRPPVKLDASAPHWPLAKADAVVSINMVHISPWASSLGLIGNAARLLPPAGPLILYGPWIERGVATAPSNLAFDADLKARDPDWGLRCVEDFAECAADAGLALIERRPMPANNLMLLLRRS